MSGDNLVDSQNLQMWCFQATLPHDARVRKRLDLTSNEAKRTQKSCSTQILTQSRKTLQRIINYAARNNLCPTESKHCTTINKLLLKKINYPHMIAVQKQTSETQASKDKLLRHTLSRCLPQRTRCDKQGM